MSKQTKPTQRSDYNYFSDISTRWMDNDVYGHINNVVYYSFFDTVINGFLLENKVLDFISGDVIGLVVETRCNYFESLAFPDKVQAGLNVERIGNSSVTYNVGIFGNDSEAAAAQGHFIHVYVDSKSKRPVAIPDELREVLTSISKQG
jgi:acyl-CoA thioester hydrolase